MMRSASPVKDEVVLHWHHIIPKYEGGTDDPDNLVQITKEDHEIIHLVRYRMLGDHRDKWASKILSGGYTREQLRREGCRDTQHRLLGEGRHNFQKNPAHKLPHVRKMHSERMKGNTLGAFPKTVETRKKIADGVRGNTNVRGRIWIVNDSTGERRRVEADTNIPQGFRKGYRLNVSTQTN